ncbi:MAG: hypothetical protein Q7V58_07305 [Actinomycetota bacterium]|nr:hypothetical protein [Actinomycetota bacterium]
MKWGGKEMGLTGRYENISAVRVSESGAVDYGLPPVKLGNTVVPARVAYIVEGANGSPSARVEFAIHDGLPICTSVHVDAAEGGRGIRSGDLNTLPGLDRLAIDAFTALAVRVADNPFDWHIGLDQVKVRSARLDIRTRGNAELEEVARVYRENIDDRPLEAVERLGYSRRTAARRVQQARVKGFLPRTTPGKKQA